MHRGTRLNGRTRAGLWRARVVTTASRGDALLATRHPSVAERVPALARLTMLVAALLLLAVGCAGGGTEKLTVSSHVITASTAPALRVLAPGGKGPGRPWWPCTATGAPGGARSELATQVARGRRRRLRADLPQRPADSTEGLVRAGRRHLVRLPGSPSGVARRYGGDLSQPVTVVGWSLGADLAVLRLPRTSVSILSTGRCPGELRRPDVVVALVRVLLPVPGQSGHLVRQPDRLDQQGLPTYTWWPATMMSRAPPPRQSRLASLTAHARGTTSPSPCLRQATHGAPIFHEDRNGRWQVVSRRPLRQAVRPAHPATPSTGSNQSKGSTRGPGGCPPRRRVTIRRKTNSGPLGALRGATWARDDVHGDGHVWWGCRHARHVEPVTRRSRWLPV